MFTVQRQIRDIADRDANDLFEMERTFLESFQSLGPCETTRKIAESTLETVTTISSCEKDLAEAAKFRGDEYHYDIAYMRRIHAEGIARSMRARIERWFSTTPA